MTILEIISQIEEDKKARKVFPTHSLFREIIKIYGDEKFARNELNRLYKEGKIKVGDTINDKYVLLIN